VACGSTAPPDCDEFSFSRADWGGFEGAADLDVPTPRQRLADGDRDPGLSRPAPRASDSLQGRPRCQFAPASDDSTAVIPERLTCPECGAKELLPVLMGMPTPALEEAALRGEVMLGGCIIGPDDPEYACARCGFELGSGVDF
jgi:DNA-directed RNA polymerase subunit RPC12/RpoP